jgi:hypothetical protein
MGTNCPSPGLVRLDIVSFASVSVNVPLQDRPATGTWVIGVVPSFSLVGTVENVYERAEFTFTA